MAVFSIFFISVFYKNIFSIWKFTEIYPGRRAAGRPGPGRPTVGRQGLFRKKNTKNNCRQVPRTGRPAAGWPAPLAARLPGGRLSLPYIRVGWSPHPSFASLQFQKKNTKNNCRQVPGTGRPAAGRPALPPYIRVGWSPHPSFASLQFQKQRKKEREGERRSPAVFSSRRLQVTKILLRFTNSMIVCPDMSSNYFC